MSYVSEVVEFVAARRGSPTILSPGEYAVIAEWEKQEIPMRLIFGAFDKAINENGKKQKTQSSIEELDEVVCLRYAEWLRNKNEARSA